MLCAHPYGLIGRKRPVACGRCMNCRVNRKRFWTGRMLMEWAGWRRVGVPSVFGTLTYNDAHLPTVFDGISHQSTLDPNDTRKWLMRWRKAYGPIRYFLVGEYGDVSQRAHYHFVFFNPPFGGSSLQVAVEKTWTLNGRPLGHVQISEMNEARARYCAGYAVKKLDKSNGKLGARYPEFMRVSKLPPLGHQEVTAMRDALLSKEGAAFMLDQDGVVPRQWRHDGKVYPLGAFWRRWLSEETGYDYGPTQEEDLPEDWEEQLERAKAQEAKALRRRPEKGQL